MAPLILEVCCTDSVIRIIKCELHSFTISFGSFFVFSEILSTRIKLKNDSKFLEMHRNYKYNFVWPFRLQIKGETMTRETKCSQQKETNCIEYVMNGVQTR